MSPESIERRLKVIANLKDANPDSQVNVGLPRRERQADVPEVANTPWTPPAISAAQLSARLAAVKKDSDSSVDNTVPYVATASVDMHESVEKRSRRGSFIDRLRPVALYSRAQGWNYSRKSRHGHDSREQWSTKKKATALALGIVAVGIGAVMYHKFGFDFSNSSDGAADPSLIGGGTVDQPSAPIGPESTIDTPPAPSGPSDISSWSDFDPSARQVTAGEGWNSTLEQMGVPKDQWSNVLNDAGPKLQELSEAYFDDSNQEWRISEPGKLSADALRVIVASSSKNGIEL